VFEPIEFAVEPGKKTVLKPPSGTVEFQWPADDLWILSRGEQRVALHSGTASRVVAPGRYRIAPNSDPVFEPLEFAVEDGMKTVLKPPSGTIQFQWPANDLWILSRGEQRVALGSGTARRFVAPGRYRIAPNSGNSFRPVEFTVTAGKETFLSPKR
jgi:hypothetical protein